MPFDIEATLILHHFIKPEHLIALMERKAFHLMRQDKQSDPRDGKLPDACFENPHKGQLEEILGVKGHFLKNHAMGIDARRSRRFIMSWTRDPSAHMREKYGENGRRCELQASAKHLTEMLEYEWRGGCEFPPKRRDIAEIPGSFAQAELKKVIYANDGSPVSLVPSYFATMLKDQNCFAQENEIRIEAVIQPDQIEVKETDTLIRWAVVSFRGIKVILGENIALSEKDKIKWLASNLDVPILN